MSPAATKFAARVEAEAFASALRAVVPFAQGLATVYSGVKLAPSQGTLTLEATNGNERVVTIIDAGAKPGPALIVPARILDGFVKTVSGAVELKGDTDHIVVSADPASFDLRTMTGEEWPVFAEVDAPEVELTEAWEGVKRVMHAQAAAEDKTPVRHAVRFEKGAVIAHSTRGVSFYDVDGLETEGANVPGEFLAQLVRAVDGPVFGRFSPRSITFRCGRTQWTGRTVGDSYPPWRSIVRDESPHELRISRTALLASLQRLALLPEDQGLRRMRVHFGDDEIVLTANGPDVGTITDVIACTTDYQGEDYYLLISDLRKVVENAMEDILVFGLQDAYHQLTINEGPWNAVFMPLDPRKSAPPVGAPPKGAETTGKPMKQPDGES